MLLFFFLHSFIGRLVNVSWVLVIYFTDRPCYMWTFRRQGKIKYSHARNRGVVSEACCRISLACVRKKTDLSLVLLKEFVGISWRRWKNVSTVLLGSVNNRQIEDESSYEGSSALDLLLLGVPEDACCRVRVGQRCPQGTVIHRRRYHQGLRTSRRPINHTCEFLKKLQSQKNIQFHLLKFLILIFF